MNLFDISVRQAKKGTENHTQTMKYFSTSRDVKIENELANACNDITFKYKKRKINNSAEFNCQIVSIKNTDAHSTLIIHAIDHILDFCLHIFFSYPDQL